MNRLFFFAGLLTMLCTSVNVHAQDAVDSLKGYYTETYIIQKDSLDSLNKHEDLERSFQVLSKEQLPLIEKVRNELNANKYDFVKQECKKMLEDIERNDSCVADSLYEHIYKILALTNTFADRSKESTRNALLPLLKKRKWNRFEKSTFFSFYINYQYNLFKLICPNAWHLMPDIYFSFGFYEALNPIVPLMDYNMSGSGRGYEMNSLYLQPTDSETLMMTCVPTLFEPELAKEFYDKIESQKQSINPLYMDEVNVFLSLLKLAYENKAYLAFDVCDY